MDKCAKHAHDTYLHKKYSGAWSARLCALADMQAEQNKRGHLRGHGLSCTSAAQPTAPAAT
eukprot:811435-Pelagomonas_calceolata.AAC.1